MYCICTNILQLAVNQENSFGNSGETSDEFTYFTPMRLLELLNIVSQTKLNMVSNNDKKKIK